MAETLERPEITIPDNHIEFCRAIAAVCKAHKVDNVSMTFNPGFEDPWRNTIRMSWEQGRHGDAAEKLHLSSQVDVWTRIDGKEPQAWGRR